MSFPDPAGTARQSRKGGVSMLNQDQLQAIKAPFPPEALSSDTSRGFELTSIKAAFVIERLNDVLGPCGIGWRYVGDALRGRLPIRGARHREWAEGDRHRGCAPVPVRSHKRVCRNGCRGLERWMGCAYQRDSHKLERAHPRIWWQDGAQGAFPQGRASCFFSRSPYAK